MAPLYLRRAIHIGRQKCPVRHHIDNSGNAVGITIKLGNRRIRKYDLHAARRLHPVSEIGINLLQGKRQKMKSGGDALGHLAHMGLAKLFLKLRLPHQNHLKNLLVVGFNVCQESDLLHHLVGNQLSLVYKQHCPFSLSMQSLQKITDKIGQRSFAGVVRNLNTELLADFFQHFQKRQRWVINNGSGNILGHGIQKSSQNHRLAGSHLSGEQHKASGIHDAVPQHGQGLLMMTAEIKVFGIRRDAEGKLAQSEKTLVHDLNLYHENPEDLEDYLLIISCS